MLSLAEPWWLAGWLLLPVIRWLHRGGRHRRLLPVVHLSLWGEAAADSAAQTQRQPPDPAWRRRALLAGLVLTALAAPQWPPSQQRVTLWVDDSLSLLTRESQGTRLASGLAQARGLLAAMPDAEIEVRTLGNPWQAWPSPNDAAARAIAAGAGAQEPVPPPAALLAPDREHWLLTDGVDASLLAWPGGARPDRVLTVGQTRRNVGLRRLAARRSPHDARRLEVSVELLNGGDAAETRELLVTVDDGPPARSALQLAAGATVHVALELPFADAAARLRATLSPADALDEDDLLAAELLPLARRRVADDPGCPASLRAAVQAHPALSLQPSGAAEVQVRLECAALVAASNAAVIGVRADRVPVAATGALLWSAAWPAARRLALEDRGLRLASRIAARPGDEVWLAAGAEPVIVARAATPARLDTVLDFDALARSRASDVPLLVNLMFERLVGSRLLDAVIAVERPERASRVVPAAAEAASAAAVAGPAAASSRQPPLQQGVRPLLLAALLVLAWELLALGRQWLRLRSMAWVGWQ